MPLTAYLSCYGSELALLSEGPPQVLGDKTFTGFGTNISHAIVLAREKRARNTGFFCSNTLFHNDEVDKEPQKGAAYIHPGVACPHLTGRLPKIS